MQGGGCLAEGGDVPAPFNTFSTSGGLSAADVHAPPPISFFLPKYFLYSKLQVMFF